MVDKAGAEYALYKRHPDLWAVSRVLTHCKGEGWGDLRQTIWDALTEDQRSSLERTAKGLPLDG